MRLLFYILPVFIIIGISCSNGSNPSVSSLPNDKSAISSNDPYSQIVELEAVPPGVLGIWELRINTDKLTATLEPVRAMSAIGNIFDADLSQFLMVSPCSNCLWLGSLMVTDDDRFQFDICMKHPFDNIGTRPDLHGFDVRAIFLSYGAFQEDPNITITKPDGTIEPAWVGNYRFLNADGYTSHYSELIADDRYFLKHETIEGNLFPYLRFFEDASAGIFDPQAPSGYNVMPVGSTSDSRTAVINTKGMDSTGLVFYIIADVAYGQSSIFLNRQNPQYYLPAFNRTEPWRVEYWFENNVLDPTEPTSTGDLVVQVFDWQHNFTVDPSYPNPSNLAGLPESSRVTEVEVSIPDMMSSSVKATIPETGDGMPESPLRYRLQVTNELQKGGIVQGFIAVRDEIYGKASPSGRVPVPESPAGFPYSTSDIRDYALYQIIYVNVPLANGNRLEFDNELDVEWDTLYAPMATRVDVEFFMDPGKNKFQYDWDFDYDGVNFDVDGSGIPSPYMSFASYGKHPIGFRVRTNSVPPREYIYQLDVCNSGVVYKDPVNTSGFLDSATSSKRGHSIAMTEDHCYFAYTNKAAGRWDIYIAIIEPDTLPSFYRVTQADDENYFDPSITIIEDGAHKGVYLLFTSRPDGSFSTGVYSSFGYLNGSGFDLEHIKTVSSGGSLSWSSSGVICNKNDGLYCYYQRYSLIDFKSVIRAARSIDYGLTWIDYTDVESSSPADSQANPSVTIMQGRVYCVWEDDRNEASNGIDLMCAESLTNDLLLFDPPVNITTSSGLIDDIDPEICSRDVDLYIAYLQKDQNSGVSKVHVQKRDLYLEDVSDNIPHGLSGFNHTAPSIYTAVSNRIILALGAYDDNSDKLYIQIGEMYYVPDYNYFHYYSLIYEDVGTIDAAGAEVFPAVVSRQRIHGEAVESFIIYQNYSDGFDKETSPFTKYFGEIYLVNLITQGM